MKTKFLCLLLCFLVASCSIPVFASVSPEASAEGNWLYVGGSGPGNYTRIQDAINASHDGDTVFVYDDSSPYYERLTINTSISLVGESRETTILDGNGTITVFIKIKTEGVIIKNFTIRNCVTDIVIGADDVTIDHNTLSYANTGIELTVVWMPYTPREHLHITDNLISHTYFGILTNYYVNDSFFQGNVFEKDHYGIVLSCSCYNTIQGNMFQNISEEALLDCWGVENLITLNTFEENTRGVDINCSWNDTVTKNNFLANSEHAVFEKLPHRELRHLQGAQLYNDSYILNTYQLFGKTMWDANYWNTPHAHPYLIKGWSVYWRGWYIGLPHVLRFEVDSHPAQQPYPLE